MRSILLILALCIGFVTNAQYNKWAFSAELGSHSVGDKSAIVTDAHNHFGLEARYSLNPTVSLGVTGGWDNLTLEDLAGDVTETNYSRLSAELFVDLFDIIDLQNDIFTVIGHGGPGVSFIRTSGYNDDVFSVTGGIKGLFKVSRHFAAYLGYRTTANVTQDMTLDGFQAINSADINSTVSNFSVGLTFYPGKKGRKAEHGDWYVSPAPVYKNTYVTNEYITNEYTQQYSTCECEILEYVFFEHDKSKLDDSSLNPIAKVYTYLSEYPNSELTIRGYASATKSSNAYNQELSRKRVQAIADKLESMGADMNRVSQFSYGKDFNWKDEVIHDMARRVELIIVNKQK